MSELCRFLAGQGPAFLLAATCLLALGWLGMAVQRATVHRQRAGELAIFGVLVWLALAVVPLPRISLSDYLPVAAPGQAHAPATSVDPGLHEHADVDAVDPVPPLTAEKSKADDPDPKTPEVLGASGVGAGTQLAAPSRVLGAAKARGLGSPDVPRRSAGSLPAPASQATVVLSAGPSPRGGSAPRAGTDGGPVFAVRVPLPAASPGNADAREPGAPESVGRSPPIDWACVVAAAYAAGSLGCVVWLALGRVVLWRVCRTASRPAAWLERLYAEVASGRRHKPRLLVSPGSGLAFTVGVWRPAIVLPEAVCRPERETTLRHLVLHELAHVRQRDSLGRLLFNLAFPFLYFHPLYWLLRSGVALAAEMIADDEAAGRTACASYVGALVALARERQPRRLVALSSHGLFGSSSQFYRRMRMLLVRKTRLASRCSWRWRLVSIAVGVVVVAVLAATVGVAPAAAQKPESSQSETAGQASLPTAQDAQALDALRQERDELKRQIDRLQAELKAMQLREAELQKARSRLSQAQKGHDEVLESKGFLAPSGAATPGATSPAAPGPYPLLTLPPPVEAAAAPPTTLKLPEEAALSPRDLTAPPTTPAPVPPTPARPVPPESGDVIRRGVSPLRVAPPHEGSVLAQMPMPVVEMEVAAGRATGDGSQLDLISLANSYTDAVTNVKIASVEHARLQQLRKSAAVSEQEAEIAAIKLEAAHRKVDLLRSIAQTALKTTEAELRVLREWHKTGRQVAGAGPIELQVRRAEGRLEILVRIVQQ